MISEKKEKIYFCPHCRVLNINNDSFKTTNEEIEKFDYHCPKCRRYFNDNTYREKSRKGCRYKLPHKYKGKKTIDAFIKRFIIELHKEHFLQREIHDITHFSKSMIQRITAIYNEKDPYDKCSIENFALEYLKIDKKIYYKIIKHCIFHDDLIDSVHKTLLWGCSFNQTAKIFGITKRTVQRANEKKRLDIKDIKKGKIKIEDGTVTVIFPPED